MPLRQRALFGFLFAVFAAIALAYSGTIYFDKVDARREETARSDAKELGIAVMVYTEDHGRYPDAGKWEQELKPYVGGDMAKLVNPPAPFQGTARRFSYNPALSGKKAASIDNPSSTWMFYESVSTAPSASDNLDAWPDPARDRGQMFAVVWADSHSYSRPFEWKHYALLHQDPY